MKKNGMSFGPESGWRRPAVVTGPVARRRCLIAAWAVWGALLLSCLSATAQASEPFKRYSGYETLEEFVQALEGLTEHEHEFLWGSVLAEKLKWVAHVPAPGETPIATRAWEMFRKVQKNHTKTALVDIMFDVINKDETWRRMAKIATDTSQHWSVRNQAIGHLTHNVGEESLLVCQSLLVDTDGKVRFKAAQALWDYGKPAWPLIASGMKTSDVEIRRGIVAGLSYKKMEAVVGELSICTKQELLDALIAMYEVEEDARVLQYLPRLIFELEPDPSKRTEIVCNRREREGDNFAAVYYGLMELWGDDIDPGKDVPGETDEMRRSRMLTAILKSTVPYASITTHFLVDLPSTKSYSSFLAAVRVLSSPIVRKQIDLLEKANFSPQSLAFHALTG